MSIINECLRLTKAVFKLYILCFLVLLVGNIYDDYGQFLQAVEGKYASYGMLLVAVSVVETVEISVYLFIISKFVAILLARKENGVK